MPPPPGDPPLTEQEIDEQALEQAPPQVRVWKEACEQVLQRSLKRHDEVPLPLDLPVPPPGAYRTCGVYTAYPNSEPPFLLEMSIPLHDKMFRKPRLPRKEKHGPSSPTCVGGSGLQEGRLG